MSASGFRWLRLAVLAPALAACVAGGAAGERLDGAWNLVAEACGDPLSETRLEIGDARMRFYESRCAITQTFPGPDAVSAVLDCRGEGQAFTRQVVLRRMGNLLELAEDGRRLIYHRCDG